MSGAARVSGRRQANSGLGCVAAGLLGAVMAGGESRRMGRDKAGLRLAGEPLWRRQARVLAEAGAEPVVIVRRPGQRRLGRQLETVRDTVIGAGPLAGLQAALTAGGGRPVAVLAVDMPAVDAAWFHRLWAKCRAGVGAVARHEDGYEPLAAIFPGEALPEVAARLARGERSMQELVRALVRRRRLKVVRLAEAERWRVANWNRPEDAWPRSGPACAGPPVSRNA